MSESVFNRETVLTAAMQAVQEFGWYHVGPMGTLLNHATGESCLVGEILKAQGILIPMSRRGEDVSVAIDLLKERCGERLEVERVESLLRELMDYQDKGVCWGRAVELVS